MRRNNLVFYSMAWLSCESDVSDLSLSLNIYVVLESIMVGILKQ